MKGGEFKNTHGQKVVEELLKELRVDAGLRQVDIARVLGVQQSVVSKYEAGERRLDILEVRKICGVLGLTLFDFVKLLEDRLGE